MSRTGSLVYEAPANSQSLSLLVLDSINGHMLIPIRGAAPRTASGLGGASRSNSAVDLAVTGVNWSDGPADRPGTRTLIVGVKGISRQEAIADIPFGEFGFLQTDQGCMAGPENRAEGVSRPLSPMGRFPPFAPSEGQLAFVVPADSKGATLLLRVRDRAGSLDLPVVGNAKPSWPSPEATITDGDVLKVHRLPGTAVPAGVPPRRPDSSGSRSTWSSRISGRATGLSSSSASSSAWSRRTGSASNPRATAPACRAA